MVHFSLEVVSHYSFYNNTFNEDVMITRLNSVVTNLLAHISQLKIKVARLRRLLTTWPRNLAIGALSFPRKPFTLARFRSQVAGRRRGLATLIFSWEMCASKFVTTEFSLVIITFPAILL